MVFVSLRYFLLSFLVTLLMFGAPSSIKAADETQITFIITKKPVYTPTEDTIFLSGTINSWKLSDKSSMFRSFPDGTMRLTLNMPKGEEVAFKINRGSWATSEGGESGEYMENRKFSPSDSTYDYTFEVKTWEDLHKLFYPPVKLVLIGVPSYTPSDARIYVSGSFNNWSAGDPEYEMKKMNDGTYEGFAGKGLSRFEYKFNRGDWASSEGRFDGGPKSNRTFVNSKTESVVISKVESWEDLSIGQMWRHLVFILLLIEAAKIIFVAFSFTRSKYPFIILSIIFIGFLFRLIFSNAEGFEFFPKAFLLPAVFYSFLGPLMYYWLESDYASGKFRWSYLLTAVPILVQLPLLLISSNSVHDLLIDNTLSYLSIALYAYGLCINLFFGYKAVSLIRKMRKEIAEWKYLLFRGWIILGWFTLALFVLAGILLLFNIDYLFVRDWLENLIWIEMGVLLILLEIKALLYFISYAIKGKIKTFNPNEAVEVEDEEDSWTILKPRLIYLMEEKEVFTNAKLSLSDLAQALGTNTNYVSRLLNEGLKTSFADFVNAYRIKYFIRILKEDKNQSKTFLYHAYNSGFNSKSAFNRAFKKYTGKTPSEYFVNLDVPDLEGN